MRRRHPFAWAWMAMAAAVLAGCTTASPDGQSSSAPQGPPIHFSCSDGSKRCWSGSKASGNGRANIGRRSGRSGSRSAAASSGSVSWSVIVGPMVVLPG